MKTAVFTYGTLQFPEVMVAVTGGTFASVPALLENYACYSLKGKSYPGIRRQPGALTQGILYTGIDARALQRLDDFEDDFYRRQTLLVVTADGARTAAEVYVVAEERYELLASNLWDSERFKEHSLQRFLSRCRAQAPIRAPSG